VPAARTGILQDARRRANNKPMFCAVQNKDVSPNPALLSMLQNMDSPTGPTGPAQAPPPAGDAGGHVLHQALLQTGGGAAQGPGANATQTFLATCSDIESLSALIQEGGTEVTVVTEGIGATTASPAAGAPMEEAAAARAVACVGNSALACVAGGGGLLVPSIHLGGQGVVLHSLPLIVSSQPHRGPLDQLPTSTLYTDSEAHIEGMSQ
jgi:hypothetical protein